MARWTVKGLAQTEAMLREKSIRVATLERRIGHSVSTELKSLFTGQAFRLLDKTMKKEIRRTEEARENLPKMMAPSSKDFEGRRTRASRGPWT